jgi:hypothetical protein
MQYKKEILYASFGIFVGLILLNSRKPYSDQTTNTQSRLANFDANSLPKRLKPPKRVQDDNFLPKAKIKKKSFHSLFLGSKNIFI